MRPLLSPPLALSAHIQDLERLWLETSCWYACFDETVMRDEEWDQLAVELWERKAQLSPYFCHATGLEWPVKDRRWKQENPLKTTMGVDWDSGLPAVVFESIMKDGEKRLIRWEAHLKRIRKEAHKRDTGLLFDESVVMFREKSHV
jgi:hypothetical protein